MLWVHLLQRGALGGPGSSWHESPYSLCLQRLQNLGEDGGVPVPVFQLPAEVTAWHRIPDSPTFQTPATHAVGGVSHMGSCCLTWAGGRAPRAARTQHRCKSSRKPGVASPKAPLAAGELTAGPGYEPRPDHSVWALGWFSAGLAV